MSDARSENLWPADLLSRRTRTPGLLLMEQAKYLNALPKSAVTGTIETRRTISGKAERVIALLVLSGHSRSAEDRVALFRVEYDNLAPYPATIRCKGDELIAKDEEDLAEKLRGIFAAQRTIEIFNYLQAHAEGLGGEWSQKPWTPT